MRIGTNWQRILKEDIGHLKLVFLIGPPSVGKSYWLEHEGPKHGIENPYIISMDEMTDKIGDLHNFDYDEMFAKPEQPETWDKEEEKMIPNPKYTETQYHDKFGGLVDQPFDWKTWEPKAWKHVAKAQVEAMQAHDNVIAAATASGRPIVVDMTNMSSSRRKGLVSEIDAPNHELIAVVFDWNNDVQYLKDMAAERSRKRFEKTGRKKTIPADVIDRMVDNYEPPSEEEGWDKIIHVPAWWIK